ncbi:protein kinase domain-containing protein [Nonomuraea insulae]|uniref:Protein kinase n=1 Tax=Nonomuraea insulae TaxID=1616787 RepID=A0ABW1CJK4_9ACTN
MTSYSPLRPGDPPRLGGLELLGRLGEGGQGVVYLAADPAGTRVAVKWLRRDQSDDAVSIGRFLREAEVARQVAPFCTAAVIGTGVEQGRPYIVSEFVDGPSLQAMVMRDGPRTGSALDRLAIGTATALAAIHQGGIVHRDFKPANVIVGADGPRVIDFGIARALAATSTFSDTPVGTPAYMSPEHILGEAVGPAADLFSWAGTMVYASCGRAPFGNDALRPVMSRVLKGPPDLGRLDGPLRDVVQRCLSKDPAERPTAEQVIKRLLGHSVPDASLLEWGARQAAPTGVRGRMGPVATGVAAAATVVLVVALVWAVTAVPGIGSDTASRRTSDAAPLETTGAASGATPRETTGAAPDAASRETARASRETAGAAPLTAPVTSTLPGGAITLFEQPKDPIALTAYEITDKKLGDDADYARQSSHGPFDRYPRNWESRVSPDGRYLAGRPQQYTSDGHDSVLITDRVAGASFRVKTVRKPLISTIRSWSKDGSRILLNVSEKVKDDWVTTGFAVVDVNRAKVSVVDVADASVQGSNFAWDGTETGVIAVYGKNEGLRFFDASGGRVRDVPGVGSLSSGTTDMFSPSGRTFVTDCPGDGGGHCLWDTATGKRVRAFSSDCDKVLGWYDESHLYCWELDNSATLSEVQVVAFDGRLVRKLLEVPDGLNFFPYFTPVKKA